MIKISAYELNKQKQQIKMAAFADEFEKLATPSIIAKITKMFGRKAMRKAMSYAKATGDSAKRGLSKKPKRGGKKTSGKGLNWAQKGVGRILYRGKQLIKNPRAFFKDEMFSSKYRRVDPTKIKKGTYKTMFGYKRKVVGYGGKTPYIKKRLPTRVLNKAFTTPGFAAMGIVGGRKRDKKGHKIGVAERGLKGTAEGIAWRIAPTATLGAMLLGARSNHA